MPDPLFKKHSVKCLTFEEDTRNLNNDNLGLNRALALDLHRNERLQDGFPKLLNLFLEKTSGTDPEKFRGVCIQDLAAAK